MLAASPGAGPCLTIPGQTSKVRTPHARHFSLSAMTDSFSLTSKIPEDDTVKYRPYGKFEEKISQLGFGAMRLPKDEDGNLDMDQSVKVMRHAYDMGVNYFDTAYGYNGGDSEKAVGAALADIRDEVYISTKIPIHASYADVSRWRELMEEQLERLQTDYIDFWNFHDLKYDDYKNTVLGDDGLLKVAQKAKEDGIIRHICLSCHAEPPRMMEMVQSGHFDGITLQYNLLDRANTDVIDYCRENGMGVIVMGPVGGGQLARPSKRFAQLQPEYVSSLPELAIRYVLANNGVTCALSGMNSMKMVQENCEAADSTKPLSDSEVARIEEVTREMDRLAELYCTGCGYCMPCPHGVAIPKNFKLMNQYRAYGFERAARKGYSEMPTRDEADEGLRASECVECGACLDKCPQDIQIPDQLKEVDETLSE